jgi:Ca2+-transporting ATPase
MSKQISYVVIIVCIILYFLLISNGVSSTLALLIISAVAVAGIPESFPLALTLSLSNGVKRMAKKNALLKNLNAVETLGNTTVICTDKTGTLTENKMMITKLFHGLNTSYDISGLPYVPNYNITNKDKEVKISSFFKEFFVSSILCNDSLLIKTSESWKLEGEPTEGAFLSFAKSQGYDEIEVRDSYKKIDEVAFSPEKKYMITVHKLNNKKQYVVSMKGAAERIVEKCRHYRDDNGKLSTMTPKMKKHFLSIIESSTSEGYRVMGVASKHITNESEKKIKDNIEHSFTLEGIVAIEDPIRPEVYDAVKECSDAGIKIVMITGDHKLTAEAIAKKLNIISSSKDLVFTGDDLSSIDDSKLDSIIADIKVFSRVTPDDKFRIISSFQRVGEVVAMTGDGVNDAPALKKSDIGISMGKNGTEVAREASDMILLDDNFATIVVAVKEGRTIFSNIRRFIYYLLTINLLELHAM